MENQWGGREGSRKHFFVNFCFLELLYLSVGEGLRVGAENLIWRPAEISSFSSRDLSRRNKHDSIWLVSTRYFYILFLWAIVVSDFLPLEIHKHLVLPLSSITFTANSRADNHFYKYISLLQILYNMKSEKVFHIQVWFKYENGLQKKFYKKIDFFL